MDVTLMQYVLNKLETERKCHLHFTILESGWKKLKGKIDLGQQATMHK